MTPINWAPAPWRLLLAELNGTDTAGRVPDGEPFIRDVDAPCELYEPVDMPDDRQARGDCLTDGHYLCAEGLSVCAHISLRELRRRRDRCEDCGTKLTYGDECPRCDNWPAVLQ